MKILFLSQRVPYPPIRGDKITTWRIVDRMKRDHDVTVIAFAHDEGDRKAADALRGMGIETVTIPHHGKRKKALALPLLATAKPLTLGVYGSRKFQAEVDNRIEGADLGYAYSSSMGAFLMSHDTPWIMHFAELDSDKWRQYADKASFPANLVYVREWRTLLDFEMKIVARTRQNIFVTPLEERIFREQIPGYPSLVLRNGVDMEHFQPAPAKAEAGHIVFTGVMDYYPNIDACIHFVEDVLPLVRSEFPDVRFSIVGSHPTAGVRELAEHPGVEVTGFVDETRDWLARAQLAIAPLRIARGIQNKVLEAMAMGLPVVGTTSSTRGVNGTPGVHYLVADGAEAEAKAVCSVLSDAEGGRKIGAAARRFVEENYDWDVVLRTLDNLLNECMASTA